MITLSQENLSLMMEAGYIYLGMQRFKEARAVFEGVGSIRPDSEIPLVALGGVAFCRGKIKEAIHLYRKALEIVPDSLYAKAYLGEALFFNDEKKEAIQCLKAVQAADPKGAIGDFARALLDAIQKGFTPGTLSQKKEIEEFYAKEKK